MLGCRVLSLVENDHGVTQRSASHEGEGGYLNDMFLHHLLQLHLRQHVLQRVVQRLQIWVYLILHITRQESQLLTSLYGRTREDDLLRRLLLQSLYGKCDGEVGLSRTGRSYGKHHVVLLVGIDEPLLVLRACLDRSPRHGIAYDTLRHLVLRTMSLHDVQDVLLVQRIKPQHVLAQFLGTLLEGSHLLLVTQDADDIVSCHDAQLWIQSPQHLQMPVPCPVEHDRVNIL